MFKNMIFYSGKQIEGKGLDNMEFKRVCMMLLPWVPDLGDMIFGSGGSCH